MRIKMLNTESGRHPDVDNGQYHCLVGHEYDLPDDLAEAWVAKGIAKKAKATKTKAAAPPKTDVKEETDGD